ncbi:4-hydroxyphenylacetate 3-hydroxylase N-terminal domain-containing protein, partial [Xenorhabdus bovienii]|uniref:4-hydroxyphenylacetate 3-hydroxylase N-terminal domain-containing protein n=1 Tax=Xenorhabdus bovienii TaxID=40576 RepID=UPI0023B22245
QYIEDLRDGRTIFINGEKITHHVDHPAFKNAIRTVAGLYDYQKDNFGKMTFLTESGNRIGRYWEFPTTAQKLIERGQIAYDWAMQGA